MNKKKGWRTKFFKKKKIKKGNNDKHRKLSKKHTENKM